MPRKRSKAQSCEPCRRRKLKCDRGWPCGACRDRNEQHLCTWEDGVVPERAGRDVNESAMMLQRMATLENQFERLLERLDNIQALANTNEAKPVPKEEVSMASAQNRRSEDLGDVTMESLGLFGMYFLPSGLKERQRALLHMHSFMLSPNMIELLFETFLSEVPCLQHFVDPAYLKVCSESIMELRKNMHADQNYVYSLDVQKITDYIYAEALSFAIFGTTLIVTRDIHLESLPMEYESISAHLRFFKEALIGMSSLSAFEEPDIRFVVIMTMLVWGLNATRKLPMGMTIHFQTVQIALLLDLNKDPPADMPEDEAKRRVRIYAELYVQDRFATTLLKRYPLIKKDPVRMPSLFGTDEEQSRYFTDCERHRLKVADLYCRSSELVLPLHDTYKYVCDLHEEAVHLQSLIPLSCENVPLCDALQEHKKAYMIISDASLSYLLIRIHLPYYMRGWDDEAYQLSRDTCFSSARSLLRLFREAFSWKIPKPKGDGPVELYVPEEVSVTARMWFFCHWATAAALLLVQHLTILNEREDHPRWDASRESIVQDLCTMSRLLNYLSPISSIAREGLESMQRVAAHAMRQNFGTTTMSMGNCVMYWANRNLQRRPNTNASRSSEPINVLNNMVHKTGISRDAYDVAEKEGEAVRKVSTPAFDPSGTNTSPGSTSTATPMNSSGPGMTPSMSETDLDTFWAKFSLPTDNPWMDLPNFPADVSMLGNLPEPSSLLLPQTQSLGANMDISQALQPRDQLVPELTNFNIGTIGSFTDDFLRSIDNYKGFDHGGTPTQMAMPVPQFLAPMNM